MISPSPLLRTTAPLYDRRSRMTFEFTILFFVVIDLAFIIPYVIQLWCAPIGKYTYDGPPPPKTRKDAMLATYLIPLALTIIVNFVGVALYWNTVVPMVYAICIALVCIPGWIVTLTIWSGCHERSYDTVAKYCYQYYLEYENRNWRGLQQGLNYGYMVISSVIIAIYFGYLYTAVRDLHRYKRNGSPTMPNDVLELTESRAYHEN